MRNIRPTAFNITVKRGTSGFGLFASEPIQRRKFVIEYWGRLITPREAETINSKYLFDVGRGRTIDGSTRKNIARYINHSCRPNCEVDVRGGRVFVRSIKNIKAGEELTYDYGEEYWNEYIGKNCLCVKCKANKK